MKNYSSALALAAALALPMTAAQAAVEFGGDYEVNAYTLDMGDLQDDDTAALQHMLRLQAHFQNEDGVQVNARVALVDTTWEGNNGPNTDETTFNSATGSDVTLDYGYVQIPTQFGVLRVGRQETSWAHGLLVEQERRDRIQFITKLGGITVVPFYDKGGEGGLDVDDDLDSINLALTGTAGSWVWGALGIYYMADDATLSAPDEASLIAQNTYPVRGPDGSPTGEFIVDESAATAAGQAAARRYISDAGRAARDGMVIFSPFFQGEVAGIKLSGALNITEGFEREDFANAAAIAGVSELAALEDETGIAAFLRAGVPVGPVEVEGQVLYAQDGGTVNQGFDTFSSFINNDPVTNSNPLSVMNVGGALSEDQMLAALRVSGNITDVLKLQVAAGVVDVEGGIYQADGSVPFAYVDDSAEFYELNAYYQATPSTTIWATVGQLAAEDILGDDITGMSLNLRTDF